MKTLLQEVDIYGNSISILLNVILCPLILFRSSNQIGTYKYLLLTLVFVEILYAAVLLMVLPVFQTNENGWFVYASVDYVPRFWSFVILAISGALLWGVAIILAYSFVYRYAAICNKDLMPWFQEKLKGAAISVFYMLTLLFFFGHLMLCFYPTDEYTQHVSLRDHDGIDLTTHAFLARPIYYADNTIIWGSVGHLGVWSILFCLTSAVYVTTTIKLVGFFNTTGSATGMSAKTVAAQKKLFILLCLQTLVPITCNFLPCTISYILAYLQIRGDKFAHGYSTLIVFSPFIDPILVFVFVRDYRIALIQYCARLLGLKDWAAKYSPSRFTTSHSSSAMA